MKILYFSANPEFVRLPEAEPSETDPSITELQKQAKEPEFAEYGQLGLWPELRILSDAFFDARMEGLVQLEVVPEANMGDVVRYIEKFKPDIVHFNGHGEKEQLVLSDEHYEDGEMGTVEWLKRILTDQDIDVLLLNCCWSESFVEHLKDTVGFVIGADNRLLIDLSRDFSARFYPAIRDGKTVGEAYTIARVVSEQYGAAPEGEGSWDRVLMSTAEPDEFTQELAARELKLQQKYETLLEEERQDWIKIGMGGALAALGVLFIVGIDAENLYIKELVTILSGGDAFVESWAKQKSWAQYEPLLLFAVFIRKPAARIWSLRPTRESVVGILEAIKCAKLSQVFAEKHKLIERTDVLLSLLEERKSNEK
jgi:hypothetical protein